MYRIKLVEGHLKFIHALLWWRNQQQVKGQTPALCPPYLLPCACACLTAMCSPAAMCLTSATCPSACLPPSPQMLSICFSSALAQGQAAAAVAPNQLG